MYEYQAKVIDVYDGDTITIHFDMGLSIKLEDQKIRLYGLNAPEVTGRQKRQGIVSRDWLSNQILGKTVIIKTIKVKKRKLKKFKDKKGKFGRYLAVIYLDGININEQLISKGFAVRRRY